MPCVNCPKTILCGCCPDLKCVNCIVIHYKKCKASQMLKEKVCQV